MKKLFFIMAMVFGSSLMPAYGEIQETPQAYFKVAGIDEGKGNYGTPAPAAGNESVLVVPPAALAKEYTREAMTYIEMGGMAFANPESARAVTVIEGDDGYVYIGHPYASPCDKFMA